ncbi:MAG: phosphopentomutase [Clostridia bacterium]|nr:phosphopentomutase [Clostridia bacterium]
MIQRIFWLVADSFGIGHAPDAAAFGDEGADTLASCLQSGKLCVPTLQTLGLFHIDGVEGTRNGTPIGAFGRLQEASRGKDTTIGHWELCGVQSATPLPTYPDGFPSEVIENLKASFGRDILCNRPYSGTEVIRDYGEEHVKTGALIVYTSADSVLQIAAHEEIVPLEELYRCCEQARQLLQGEHGVGRVIARPFRGDAENGFFRTKNRHDYSLTPPKETVLDALKQAKFEVIGIGKIHDIFAGQGLTRTIRTENNADGLKTTRALMNEEFRGLCFVNLVDFDMVYGHRRDVDGYVRALNEMDAALADLLTQMREGDILMLTADHGCDPAFRGTDHTREAVPFLAVGTPILENVNLGTRTSFADVGATIAELFGVQAPPCGTSFAKEMIR